LYVIAPLSQGSGVEWCSISSQRVVVVVMVHFVAVFVANSMCSYCFARCLVFIVFWGGKNFCNFWQGRGVNFGMATYSQVFLPYCRVAVAIKNCFSERRRWR